MWGCWLVCISVTQCQFLILVHVPFFFCVKKKGTNDIENINQCTSAPELVVCQLCTDRSQVVRKAALGARTPPVLSKRVGVERQSEGAWDSLRLLPTPSPPQVQNKMACNPVGAPHLQRWPNPGSPPCYTATMLTMASVYSPRLTDKQLDNAKGLSFRGENGMLEWSGWVRNHLEVLHRKGQLTSCQFM